MPHALTDRQREVLAYIRHFVEQNEGSPRLEEISGHFGVTAPTAHNYLKALQSKGFLYFGRTSSSGFFIRLIERAGTAETVAEVVISGCFDEYGEILDFPSELGHFATVLVGAKQENLFAVYATADIPQASILAHDLIIFDHSKHPQPGDICIGPLGDRLFLIQIASRTYDRELHTLLTAQDYQIPPELFLDDRGHLLNWHPLAYDYVTQNYFMTIAKGEDIQPWPMLPELILGTALRLTRTLAF